MPHLPLPSQAVRAAHQNWAHSPFPILQHSPYIYSTTISQLLRKTESIKFWYKSDLIKTGRSTKLNLSDPPQFYRSLEILLLWIYCVVFCLFVYFYLLAISRLLYWSSPPNLHPTLKIMVFVPVLNWHWQMWNFTWEIEIVSKIFPTFQKNEVVFFFPPHFGEIKKKNGKEKYYLRNFQATISCTNSFDGRKMTFVIAESELWTCWDSPILTLDILVNIIHLTSVSEYINIARALLVSAPYKRMGLKVAVQYGRKQWEKSQSDKKHVFVQILWEFE